MDVGIDDAATTSPQRGNSKRARYLLYACQHLPHWVPPLNRISGTSTISAPAERHTKLERRSRLLVSLGCLTMSSRSSRTLLPVGIVGCARVGMGGDEGNQRTSSERAVLTAREEDCSWVSPIRRSRSGSASRAGQDMLQDHDPAPGTRAECRRDNCVSACSINLAMSRLSHPCSHFLRASSSISAL